MSRNRTAWAAASVVVAVLAVLLWPRSHKTAAPNSGAFGAQTNTTSSIGGASQAQKSRVNNDSKIEQLVGLLQRSATSPQTVDQLAQLRSALTAAGTNVVSAAIRRFLDSGSDSSTGKQFKVGSGGALDTAPTLRTFLLDYLGQIDPAAAAAYAKVILGTSQSPDEWALALRNLATGDSTADGRVLLEQKTSELLRREDWQHDPSVGYLEAFDAAVYLGGTNLAPVLGGLVQKKDNQAVAHAAYLALDRLVLADPAAMLATLEADPSTMQGRELTRANYFARADIRDPQQRQILETYLLDPRIGPAELAQFAGLYPNANYMVSQNLLTPAPARNPDGLRARDAESLRVVQEWLADPKFGAVQPQLQKIQSRLQEFARQAAK